MTSQVWPDEEAPVADRKAASPHAADPTPRSMLDIRNVSFSYPERDVLKDVSLHVDAGEILVLLGPNGAGKSTLVKTMSGQIRPDSGSVRVAGLDPASDADARRAAGFVPQRIAIFEKLTVRENLRIFAEVMGVARDRLAALADRTLGLVGLEHRKDDRTAILSGGMQRLVNIGAAMMHEPKLLVLDEPTVGVDNRTRDHLRQVLRSLKDSGLAILLTTHDMEEAEALADRITIIVAGEIKAEGPPREIVSSAFGDRQEVRVVLNPQELPKRSYAALCKRLSALGLETTEGTDVWEGLIDDSGGRLDKLATQISVSRPGISEVRVREPGLRTLLEWYTS